jgi:hypothetical protein
VIAREGNRVRQADYGDGEVVQITQQHVTIAFDDGTVRKFVTAIVRLEPTTTPPPPPRPQAARVRRSAKGAGERVVR